MIDIHSSKYLVQCTPFFVPRERFLFACLSHHPARQHQSRQPRFLVTANNTTLYGREKTKKGMTRLSRVSITACLTPDEPPLFFLTRLSFPTLSTLFTCCGSGRRFPHYLFAVPLLITSFCILSHVYRGGGRSTASLYSFSSFFLGQDSRKKAV